MNMDSFLENDISVPGDVEVTEPLRIYLEEIRQIPLLSEEEEQELGKRIGAGDLEAKRRLEEANLRLVVSVAKCYAGCGMQFMDLIQEGNIGLMQAVERFGGTECRFSEHAIPWIQEAIASATEDLSGEIQVPALVAESMQKVQKAAGQLRQELDREASAAEIARLLGDKTAEEVENILALLRNPASLEEQGVEDEESDAEDAEPEEVDAAQRAVESLIRKEEVAQLLKSLDETEQKVISLRFGLEDGKAHTSEEVGETIGLTEEQVSRIEETAMGKMRKTAKK